MTFFPEIDEKRTIRNAKRKLREYPKWQRIAGDTDGQKVTATYSFEPRQSHSAPSRPVEKLAINKADALSELEAIEYAVGHLLDPCHRRILYEKFLSNQPKYDFEIYSCLYMSEGSYYHALSIALIEFAEVYRHGCLLVEIADST